MTPAMLRILHALAVIYAARGRASLPEVARAAGRGYVSCRKDVQKLRALGLIAPFRNACAGLEPGEVR